MISRQRYFKTQLNHEFSRRSFEKECNKEVEAFWTKFLSAAPARGNVIKIKVKAVDKVKKG